MLMARARVHDRTIGKSDMPHNARTAVVEVDDPYPVPGVSRRIKATASLRDDPLRRLFVRHQITQPMYDAGRHWQKMYEIVEISVRGIDTTKERVDGGQFPELLTEKREMAALALKRLRKVLGKDGDIIVTDFLAHRLFIKEIAVKRGFSSSDVEYLGRRLRECLGTLARELGYATRRNA